MPAPLTEADVDYILCGHHAGRPAVHIAKELGVSVFRVKKLIFDSGFTPVCVKKKSAEAGKAARKAQLPLLELAAKYKSGVSVLQLAIRYGVSRVMIAQALRDAGVRLRGQGESELVKWAAIKNDRTAVVRQCSAAWDAARRRVRTDEEKAAIAVAVHRKRLRIFKGEEEIAEFLRSHGFRVDHQTPVGPYNLDLSINELPIAVEVVHLSASDFNKPRTGPPGGKRLEYILDRWWHVVFVIATGANHRRKILLDICGNQLVSAVQFACRNESAAGKYRVVWGKGQAPPIAKFDFGNCAAVE